MTLTKTSGLLVFPVIEGMLKNPKMSFWGIASPGPVLPVRPVSFAESVIEKGCAAFRISVPTAVLAVRWATIGTSVEKAAVVAAAAIGTRPADERRTTGPRAGISDAARRDEQTRMPTTPDRPRAEKRTHLM